MNKKNPERRLFKYYMWTKNDFYILEMVEGKLKWERNLWHVKIQPNSNFSVWR
jgi:hypothetical protein